MIKAKLNHFTLYKSYHLPVILMIGGMAFLSGCSQYNKQNPPTIAIQQATSNTDDL